jgi:hypothetical protein
MKREKTKFPGVLFLWGTGVDGKPEKIFYIRYRKDGKQIEEKAGRQFQDDMTPARANALRTDRIQGRDLPNVEKRQVQRQGTWTFSRLWQEYKQMHPLKGLAQDESRFRTYPEGPVGSKEPKDLMPLDIDRLKLRLLAALDNDPHFQT